MSNNVRGFLVNLLGMKGFSFIRFKLTVCIWFADSLALGSPASIPEVASLLPLDLQAACNRLGTVKPYLFPIHKMVIDVHDAQGGVVL